MPSVFDDGLDMQGTVNAEDALVVHMDVVVPVQFVPYPAVSHIRMRLMDLLNLARDSLVL
ncbi:hypothetical protein SDC9_182848 [bioreactor metagenome]|uniref:Uncharacterized protein n=1 Tax=bioreactor metagenome TaxID=1076179 RepID=A0A645H9H3_9ZZZZ